MDRMRELTRREQRFIGIKMKMAGDPLELRKIGLVQCATDAQRADGAGRASAETCPIRRYGSYHYRCPFERRIDANSPAATALPHRSGDIVHCSGSTFGQLIQIKLTGDKTATVALGWNMRFSTELKLQ